MAALDRVLIARVERDVDARPPEAVEVFVDVVDQCEEVTAVVGPVMMGCLRAPINMLSKCLFRRWCKALNMWPSSTSSVYSRSKVTELGCSSYF